MHVQLVNIFTTCIQIAGAGEIKRIIMATITHTTHNVTICWSLLTYFVGLFSHNLYVLCEIFCRSNFI